MRLKRRSFTLIEVSVCLAILALVGTLFSLKTFEVISHFKQERELESFASELRLSCDLARCYQIDIPVTFTLLEGKLLYQRSGLDCLRGFSKVLSRPGSIKVDRVKFAGDFLKEGDQFTVYFRNSGWIDRGGCFEIELCRKQSKRFLSLDCIPDSPLQWSEISS